MTRASKAETVNRKRVVALKDISRKFEFLKKMRVGL